MEPIFENVYKDTEEMMREQYAYGGRIRRIIYFTLYVLLLIYGVLRFWFTGEWLVLAIVAISVGYILYLLIWPVHRAKKYIQAQRKLYDGEVPQTMVHFYENEVAVRIGRENFSLPYEKITKIIILKRSINLLAEKTAFISVSPDGFTKGSVDEMYRFLRVKCPKLNLPGWKW